MIDQIIQNYNSKCRSVDVLRVKAEEDAERLEEEAAYIMQRATEVADAKKIKAQEIRSKLASDYPNLINDVLWPIANELSKATGLSPKVTGPTGICCKCTISLIDDPCKGLLAQETRTIVVQPDFEDGLSLYYETGARNERFPKGSLGEVNGMNNEIALLPNSIDGILRIMQHHLPLHQLLGMDNSKGEST